MMARGLPKRLPIEGVQHIIAVGSGKGIRLSVRLLYEVNFIVHSRNMTDIRTSLVNALVRLVLFLYTYVSTKK
jgi:hypothetical protein